MSNTSITPQARTPPRLVKRVWNWFLSLFPGTPAYSRRTKQMMVYNAWERRQQFIDLQSINFDTKVRFYPIVHHNENQLAIVEAWRKNLEIMFLQISSILLVLTLPFFIAAMPSLIVPGGGTTPWGIAFFGGMFLTLFMLPLLLILPRHEFFDHNRLAPIVLLPMFASMILTPIVIVYAFRDSPLQLNLADTARSLFTVTGLTASALILLVLGNLLDRGLWSRTTKLYPSAVIMDTLIKILSKTETQPNRWSSPNFKAKITSLLEEGAFCVEHGLPASTHTGDTPTDYWYRQQCEQMAAAFRELKKWVVTPKTSFLPSAQIGTVSNGRSQSESQLPNSFMIARSHCYGSRSLSDFRQSCSGFSNPLR